MALTTINGIDLDYADVGKGEVLVMLHGLGSTKKDWDRQIPVLSQKFRVIAPDFRAHGNSERVPKEQGVEIMTEDVFQLLNSLNNYHKENSKTISKLEDDLNYLKENLDKQNHSFLKSLFSKFK